MIVVLSLWNTEVDAQNRIILFSIVSVSMGHLSWRKKLAISYAVKHEITIQINIWKRQLHNLESAY